MSKDVYTFTESLKSEVILAVIILFRKLYKSSKTKNNNCDKCA